MFPGSLYGYWCGFHGLRGSTRLKCCLVWCPLRSAPCLLDVCVPLSFFCCLVRSPTTFLFLSLSLRRWGNPNPVWGLGFPLCSLPLGRGLRLRSGLRDPHVHQGRAQPLFLFFFLSSLAGMVVVGCGVSVSVWLGGFLVLLSLLHCMQDVS